jgi:hypothetical protein
MTTDKSGMGRFPPKMFVATIILLVAMAIFQRVVVTKMSRSSQIIVIDVGEKVVLLLYALAGVTAIWSIAQRLRRRR